MDPRGVRRRDTTRGAPLRILSLDGGGIRGYSMLIILQELMHRTFVETEGRAPRRHEIPKPCDHFDLIVGTGTGGLIAIMLGRLRLDLETCKVLYVQMTRMVFETDKTIAGIPYGKTLFKASKLEEAIKEAVKAHTASETEGNDGAGEHELENPLSGNKRNPTTSSSPRRNVSNASTISFSAKSPSAQNRPLSHHGRGDPNARLYDIRPNRTKTAITATYARSSKHTLPCILRSYDSRREPTPEYDCTIWQAGRATCAVGVAFKPITIGQSIFHDDGNGTFNPSPEALEEAVVNEWPGREVGVFVSVGTGRRPESSGINSSKWYEGFLGEFADAREKLIAKIEACEIIHKKMKGLLEKRGVDPKNYVRLNVEVGVGEFGMNEWHRLNDISISTRTYMRHDTEETKIKAISTKLAALRVAKARWERSALEEQQQQQQSRTEIPEIVKTTSSTLHAPLAVELPGDSPKIPISLHNNRLSGSSWESGLENLAHDPISPPSRSSLDRPSRPVQHHENDKFLITNITPAQYRHASGEDKISITSPDELPRPHEFPRPHNAPPQTRIEPPPLPPKTPLPENQRLIHSNGHGEDRKQHALAVPAPPYPLDEGEAPPPVNMARKPGYSRN